MRTFIIFYCFLEIFKKYLGVQKVVQIGGGGGGGVGGTHFIATHDTNDSKVARYPSLSENISSRDLWA